MNTRQIKFRGKSKATKKFVYGYLVVEDEQSFIIQGSRFYPDLSGEPIAFNKWHEIEQGTESQYTGLKDKNGNDIYEGDILKYQSEVIRKVVYKNAAFHSVTLDEKEGSPNHPLYFTTLAPSGTSEIEVIGNIYETPQLIESKTKK